MMASCPGIGLMYHLTRLSIGLKKRGHDVSVLSGPKEQVAGLSEELAKAGIRHFRSYHVDKTAIHEILRGAKDIQRSLEMEEGVDVIHVQGAIDTLEAYLAVRSLRPDRRSSIVTSVHYVPERTREGLLQKPKWAAMAMILNMCSDVILPVSDDTKERLIRHGLNPEKTITVHNAIDLEVFDEAAQRAKMDFEREESNKPTIVYIARLIPVKRQDYYLMAAAEVLKNNSAKFYVIGSGPRRKNLEELARSLGIETNVTFTGLIQLPEIYSFLSNVADICVSSSISENLPFYILECMAAGKPIVASNVGGVSEVVINEVNGYLVPPKDPSSLAKAILKLINDPGTASQMGREGRRRMEQRFSMEILTKKLGDIYEIATKKEMIDWRRCNL